MSQGTLTTRETTRGGGAGTGTGSGTATWHCQLRGVEILHVLDLF